MVALEIGGWPLYPDGLMEGTLVLSFRYVPLYLSRFETVNTQSPSFGP